MGSVFVTELIFISGSRSFGWQIIYIHYKLYIMFALQMKQKQFYMCILLKDLDKLLRLNRNIDRWDEMVYNIIVNKRYKTKLIKKIPSFS